MTTPTGPSSAALATHTISTVDARIAAARAQLGARLSELDRRVEVVKAHLDPRTWITNPWARVGAAALVGFAIGRSETVRAVARTALAAAVTTLIKQAMTPAA